MNTDVFLYSLIATLSSFLVVGIVALFFRRNDLADVFWGPGFLIAAIGGWSLGAPDRIGDLRLSIMLLLTSIWALMLFAHIGVRFLSHGKEDERYLKWRKEWGRTWIWRSLLQVFLLQGQIMRSGLWGWSRHPNYFGEVVQ